MLGWGDPFKQYWGFPIPLNSLGLSFKFYGVLIQSISYIAKNDINIKNEEIVKNTKYVACS